MPRPIYSNFLRCCIFDRKKNAATLSTVLLALTVLMCSPLPGHSGSFRNDRTTLNMEITESSNEYGPWPQRDFMVIYRQTSPQGQYHGLWTSPIPYTDVSYTSRLYTHVMYEGYSKEIIEISIVFAKDTMTIRMRMDSIWYGKFYGPIAVDFFLKVPFQRGYFEITEFAGTEKGYMPAPGYSWEPLAPEQVTLCHPEFWDWHRCIPSEAILAGTEYEDVFTGGMMHGRDKLIFLDTNRVVWVKGEEFYGGSFMDGILNQKKVYDTLRYRFAADTMIVESSFDPEFFAREEVKIVAGLNGYYYVWSPYTSSFSNTLRKKLRQKNDTISLVFHTELFIRERASAMHLQVFVNDSLRFDGMPADDDTIHITDKFFRKETDSAEVWMRFTCVIEGQKLSAESREAFKLFNEKKGYWIALRDKLIECPHRKFIFRNGVLSSGLFPLMEKFCYVRVN